MLRLFFSLSRLPEPFLPALITSIPTVFVFLTFPIHIRRATIRYNMDEETGVFLVAHAADTVGVGGIVIVSAWTIKFLIKLIAIATSRKIVVAARFAVRTSCNSPRVTLLHRSRSLPVYGHTT
jgi:hypothetical protein